MSITGQIMTNSPINDEADHIVHNLKESGDLAEILEMMAKHPKAKLKVIATKDGGLDISVAIDAESEDWSIVANRRSADGIALPGLAYP